MRCGAIDDSNYEFVKDLSDSIGTCLSEHGIEKIQTYGGSKFIRAYGYEGEIYEAILRRGEFNKPYSEIRDINEPSSCGSDKGLLMEMHLDPLRISTPEARKDALLTALIIVLRTKKR